MSISAVFQLTTDSVLASSAHLAALISGQLLAVEPVVTVELVTALGINGCGLALVVDDCTVLAAKDSSIVAAVAREREELQACSVVSMCWLRRMLWRYTGKVTR